MIHATDSALIALPISFTRESLLQLSRRESLQRKKNVLRTLGNSKKITLRKKKPLIQHGGGILKAILGTVLNAIASLWISPLEKSFTVEKMKFSIKDFFSKFDQIRSFLRIWSHLLKKSLIENSIFCAVFLVILSDMYDRTSPWKSETVYRETQQI